MSGLSLASYEPGVLKISKFDFGDSPREFLITISESTIRYIVFQSMQ
jgi:hypothetical protein